MKKYNAIINPKARHIQRSKCFDIIYCNISQHSKLGDDLLLHEINDYLTYSLLSRDHLNPSGKISCGYYDPFVSIS